MLSFVREDAPCLPIHDSFIMHHAFGESLGELEETMRRSYKAIIGSNIKVKGELVRWVKLNIRGYDGLTITDHLEALNGPPDFQGWWWRNA